EGDPVIWSLDKGPDGMSVNQSTGSVRWIPTLDDQSTASTPSQLVVLRASDTRGGFSTQSFAITVRFGNTPPSILSKPPTQAAVGRLYSYAVHASDRDGDPLTYVLAAAPDGMTIDPSSGVVHWAPAAGQVGGQHVVINVDDAHGGGAAQSY